MKSVVFFFLFSVLVDQIIFIFYKQKTGSHDPNAVPAYKALDMFLSILSKSAVTGAFIITGYPRNMRDVVEYMARVRVLPIRFLKVILSYN